jgi:cytochrome P450 family 109
MDYNPLAPEVQEDPFPYYAFLRTHHPVAWIEPLQTWTISRYSDVDCALKNPQVFSSANWLGQSLGDLNPAPEVPWMIETDPPDHIRLRKLVSKAFTPRMVSLLEPRVRAITGQLLEPLQKREFDFVHEFSGVLPVIVIAEMLGVESAITAQKTKSKGKSCWPTDNPVTAEPEEPEDRTNSQIGRQAPVLRLSP